MSRKVSRGWTQRNTQGVGVKSPGLSPRGVTSHSAKAACLVARSHEVHQQRVGRSAMIQSSDIEGELN